MLVSQRSSLITRGVAIIEAFDPCTITFAGKSPVAASMRGAGATVAKLGMGGFQNEKPTDFLILKSRIPDGITVAPQLEFTAAGVAFRVEFVFPQGGEPHVRFTANLATR